MAFSYFKYLRQLWSNARIRQRKTRPVCFRPCVESLEHRIVPATRTWTGNSIFSNHWSDDSNWQDGKGPRLDDSVFFPASAKQHTNVQDMDYTGQFDQFFFGSGIRLNVLRIDGDYRISGLDINLTGDLFNSSGGNTIDADLVWSHELNQAATGVLNIADGSSLRFNGAATSNVDLLKRSAGTLEIAGSVTISDDFSQQFPSGSALHAQDGLVDLRSGGQLRGDLVIENGGTVKLRVGGDQIVHAANVTIDTGGVLDLNGTHEGLGELTFNGGTINVGTSGLLGIEDVVATTDTAGGSVINGDVNLGSSTRTFNVANAFGSNDLEINGSIQGTGGLIKTGLGRLLLDGTTANIFSGRTSVNDGVLALGKPANVDAIAGELVIGDGNGAANADKVLLLNNEQIADTQVVQVLGAGQLNLSNHVQSIDHLNISGGNVTTGSSGLLRMFGEIHSLSSATVPGTINGRVALLDPVSNIIRVDNAVSGTDLVVESIVFGSLNKTGTGTMELTGNSTYLGSTVITDGQLLVNGSIQSSRVDPQAQGTLAGNGAVAGINANAGKIQPGDGIGTLTSTTHVALSPGSSFQPQVIPLAPDAHDVLKVQGNVFLGGSLNVQAVFLPGVPPPVSILSDNLNNPNFTATSGFILSAATFFGLNGGNARIAPAGTGTQVASWTIPNLTPGSYRVSTTAGINTNSFPQQPLATNAPFTILDGANTLATVSVNERTPTTDFSKLGLNWDTLGIVQVTGTTLTVRLTNNANGGVFADAILIESHQDVIIDNDGTDAILGTFANLPEGATVSAVAVTFVNGQPVQQNQLYTISYRANDGNDVSLAYITTATAAQDLLLTPSSINEGEKTALTGHLTDPDAKDFLTLTIDWGDGSTETQHPGTATFQFSHRYANNPPGQPHGAYPVHLHWFDQTGAGNSRDLFVTVNNVPPKLFLPSQVDVPTHGMFVLPGFFTDPGVRDRFTLTVDFGDGTGKQTIKVNPTQRFVLQHRYQQPGNYRVTVTVTDDDGEFDTVTVLVHVKKKGS